MSEDLLVAALSDPRSYPSQVPAGARLVAFLNKAETAAAQEAAAALARGLLPVYARVAAGSARQGEARAWTFANDPRGAWGERALYSGRHAIAGVTDLALVVDGPPIAIDPRLTRIDRNPEDNLRKIEAALAVGGGFGIQRGGEAEWR